VNDLQAWERYEHAYRALLCRVRQAQLQAGVRRLLDRAEHLARRDQVPREAALESVFLRTRERVIRRLLRARSPASPIARRRWQALLELSIPQRVTAEGPDFHCDAALGGLARWLRAAGYDAVFWPGIDDDELLRKAQSQPAVMLTTDRRLMERGIIQRGAIAARLVSIRLDKNEQFIDLVRRLCLPIRAPRCMACGGVLLPVDKESVKQQIPPRTYPWLDDYYRCARCQRLFWKGTHWQRIAGLLDQARAAGASG
jgi:uncharacterized protein